MQRRISVISSVKESFGGGMQGGTLNCQGFPCKQKIVSLTRHRRLAGRDPTARRWSPERRNQECRYGDRRSRVFLHSLHVLHGEVYLSFLSVLCVLCGKTVLAFFREFSCFSWLRCIFWLRLCRAKSFRVFRGKKWISLCLMRLCARMDLKSRRSRLSSQKVNND